MSHTNLKTRIQIQMEIELEAWRSGERHWNVSNQFNESVLESALDNFSNIDSVVCDWEKSGTDLNVVSVMDWAYAISDFQPSGLDSEWID